MNLHDWIDLGLAKVTGARPRGPVTGASGFTQGEWIGIGAVSLVGLAGLAAVVRRGLMQFEGAYDPETAERIAEGDPGYIGPRGYSSTGETMPLYTRHMRTKTRSPKTTKKVRRYVTAEVVSPGGKQRRIGEEDISKLMYFGAGQEPGGVKHQRENPRTGETKPIDPTAGATFKMPPREDMIEYLRENDPARAKLADKAANLRDLFLIYSAAVTDIEELARKLPPRPPAPRELIGHGAGRVRDDSMTPGQNWMRSKKNK